MDNCFKNSDINNSFFWTQLRFLFLKMTVELLFKLINVSGTEGFNCL